MGGTKRAICTEKKIENQDARAVAHSKRRHGLFSKTTELCLLSGAQVAILATPVSSNSHVSFYSYGHSSVDSVLSAFLNNERPKEELGFGRWWEDERLLRSEDPNELKSAIGAISSMLRDVKALRLEVVEKQKEKKLVSHGTHQEQTLDIPSTSKEGQMVAMMDNKSLVIKLEDCNDVFDQDQIFDLAEEESQGLKMDNVLTSQTPWSDSEDRKLVGDLDQRDCEDLNKKGKELVSYGTHQEQTLDLQAFNRQFADFDETFDFAEDLVENSEMNNNVLVATTSQNMQWSDLEAVEDEALVAHNDFDEFDKYFSNDTYLEAMTEYDKNYSDAILA